jgi:hypothetical protein
MAEFERMAIFALACTFSSLGLFACSPSSPEQKSSPPISTAMYSEFRPLVADYVRQKYGWSNDIYRIEFNRWEGTVLAFWVIHRDDEKSPQVFTGGGKSIEVWVDPAKREVSAEYHFQ